MCGGGRMNYHRYEGGLIKVAHEFGAQVQQPTRRTEMLLPSRESIRPSEKLVAIAQSGEKRILAPLTWGWQKTWGQGLIINARDDRLLTGMWSATFGQGKRCIVLLTAFFEWTIPLLVHGQPAKQGYAFSRPDGGLMALAGLYTSEGRVVIVTTEPCPLVQEIHPRMPAVLWREEAVSVWLERSISPEGALSAIRPYPGELIREPLRKVA